jgi:SecD/SecF fusion protein
VRNVSASFGRQIAQSALLAILFSLALIVLYIIVRFPGWKFALPVLAALVHDVVITVGVYSLTGREVSAATVAAVLTVLGYSMYDTVIIFDRIRENLHVMRRSSFAHITNVSIWETLVRSLATTFITLLPVASILFFGGETLKDFALALLIGIGSGAYSTIFIAAPLLALLKEKEPEFAQRGGSAAERGVGMAGGDLTLEEAEEAAADEPVPELAPLTSDDRAEATERRERRRQRRRTRPHGRAR